MVTLHARLHFDVILQVTSYYTKMVTYGSKIWINSLKNALKWIKLAASLGHLYNIQQKSHKLSIFIIIMQMLHSMQSYSNANESYMWSHHDVPQ